MSASSESGTLAGQTEMVGVWDIFIRFFHWTLATAFFIAYMTEDDLMTVHVWAGYVVGGLVVLRVLWGVVGPRYARFTDFIYRPATVLAYLRDLVSLRAKRYIGHSPPGGAMVVALLLALVAVVATGVLLYGLHDGAGPLAHLHGYGGRSFRRLIEGIHELASNLTLALVIAHIVGVLLASFAHSENLIVAMITGKKRARE